MLDQIVEYLNTTKFRFTSMLCIILAGLLLINLPNPNPNDRKCTREKIDDTLIDMVAERNRTLSDKMWLSCKDGLIKGSVTGAITGGFIGGISGGAIFGVANPVLLYITGT